MRSTTVGKTTKRTITNTEEHRTVPQRQAPRRPATGSKPSGKQSSGKQVPGKTARPAARPTRLDDFARWARISLIATLALAIAVVVGFQIAGRDNIRSGVHAFGVDLSGMTEVEARAALTAAVAERTDMPFVLTDGDRRWEVTPADLGLTMDVDGALTEAMEVGRSGIGPSRLALVRSLGDESTDVASDKIAIQGALLDADLAQLKTEIFQVKIDPVLQLDPTSGPSYTSAQMGRALDVQATRDDILAALANGDDEVALVINETEPVAWDADYADVRQRLDNIWDAPIEVVAAGEVWTLGSDQLSYWLEVHPAKGPGQPATLTTNEQWIDDVVNDIALFTNRAPQSARVWWDVGGNLIKTAEGNPGKRLQWDESRAIVHAAFLGETNANRVDLPVELNNPPALPADLNTLGITSNIGEASTAYGGGLPERMHNIELAASRLNGVLVMPGQTFSFNGEVGPTTVEAGFQIAYGIADDGGELRTIPSEAGGICQVATTVFQPVFWLGYQVDVRVTHSYWIPGYASNGYSGLDAAVDESTGLDFKWTNNSETAVLVEAEADGQYFTIRFYGTPPPWSVQVEEPKISNVEDANQDVVYQASDTIPDGQTRQIERAQDGFDVTVVRHVTQNGETRTENFSTTYGPSRNVVLVGSSTGDLPPEYR